MMWENSHNNAVSNAISRDRFEHVMTNIHCCDNDNLDTNDGLAKVRPLFDKMNQKCSENAPHVKQHSIPYFGRYPGKQFIKGKSVQYGYKLWGATTFYGYIVLFEPYQEQDRK
ncbi:Transposase IS4 [Popillia japonica]|uniref:Transposase IS4 n=1 Tax=Popillia japonica TaxID=7064 RepID=A0AAW1IBY1_POPJA